MMIGEEEVPCGIRNALLYFKTLVPANEEIEKLKPLVLTQGGVTWNLRSEENNSPIMYDFNKEVVAAAEVDALADR